jgi:hypothetical protein
MGTNIFKMAVKHLCIFSFLYKISGALANKIPIRQYTKNEGSEFSN